LTPREGIYGGGVGFPKTKQPPEYYLNNKNNDIVTQNQIQIHL
jgi:hypothetical protein